MNKSAAAATLSKEEEEEEEVTPLNALQDILHNRIMQKKEEVHDSHSKAYTGSLSREIETLHWVLAQILTLKREKRIYNSKL